MLGFGPSAQQGIGKEGSQASRITLVRRLHVGQEVNGVVQRTSARTEEPAAHTTELERGLWLPLAILGLNVLFLNLARSRIQELVQARASTGKWD